MKAKLNDLLKVGVAWVCNADLQAFRAVMSANGVTARTVQEWNDGVTLRLVSVKR